MEAAGQIESPNVVLDVGTTTPPGVPFIVMERMDGQDLAHELRSQRRLELRHAGRVIDDIAAGLDAARQVGIVHRALKPHNVFGATESGAERRWKIVDSGSASWGRPGR